MARKKIVLLLAVLFLISLPLDKIVDQAALSLRNPYLDSFMSWFSDFASLFTVLVIMTSLFMWQQRRKEWIPALASAFVSGLIVSFLLKFLFLRERPSNLQKYFLTVKDYSFPSSHTASAFSCQPVLGHVFPDLTWFWTGFALLVGISRIYLGQHHLSDVAGGMLLGYVIGSLYVHMEEKYGLFKRFVKLLPF